MIDMATGAGVAAGFAAALGMAVSYLLSRRYVLRHHAALAQLMVISHVLGAALSLPVAWACWGPDVPPLAAYFWPMAGSTAAYLMAQGGLFLALRYTDASRVSPLLGLKVAVLAGFAVVVLRQPLMPLQWVAVALSAAAAFMLNYSGGWMPLPALMATLVACLGYSLSDVAYKVVLDEMSALTPVRASLLATAISYLMCGALAVPALPWLGSRRGRDWGDALPYSLVWIAAVVVMLLSFALVGVVLANIVLATRGLLSILLGAILAHRGLLHLEQRVPAGVMLRRALAAILMAAAIGLYLAAGA